MPRLLSPVRSWLIAAGGCRCAAVTGWTPGPSWLTASSGSLAVAALLLLGLGRRSIPAFGLAVVVVMGVLVVPPAPPTSCRDSCDPFCDDGRPMLIQWGPFAILFVPVLVLPTVFGAIARAVLSRSPARSR